MRAAAPLALALALAATARPAPAVAQRVLVVEEIYVAPPRPAHPSWVITPEDPCPGATLLRVCGGTPAPTDACPELAAALAASPDDALDHCTVSTATLGVAGALFDEGPPELAAAASRIYAALATDPALRELALLRAGEAAWRASRDESALVRYAELLDATADPSVRAAAVDGLVRLLASASLGDPAFPDAAFPGDRFGVSRVPDRPWALEVLTLVLRWIVDSADGASARAASSAFRARFPQASGCMLDAIEADVLAHEDRWSDYDAHVFASAARGRARGEACEQDFLDRALSRASEQLRACRAGDDGTASPRAIDTCLAGVSLAARLDAVRPTDTLALDAADGAAWARAAAARLATPRSRAPLPVVTLRTAAPLLPVDPSYVDVPELARAVGRTPLAACAPESPAVIGVVLEIDARGALRAIPVSGPDAPAACVRATLETLSVPPPEDGTPRVEGVVFFPPRI